MAQPFVYSPYSSPQSGTIAELMLQRGAIDANRATAVANAVAQNQRANGQIAGGIAQAIGQGVGAIAQVPEQERQQAEVDKRRAMADEASQLELDDRKRAAKSRNTIEAALADQSNYKADGTADDDKIAAFLKKNDVGAWQAWQQQSAQAAKSRMDLIKSATEISASDATTQEKTQAAQKIRTDYLGSQAYDAGKQLAAHPDDAMHIRDAFLGRAGADKMISPDDFRALSMQLATAKPDQLGSVLETFVPGEMKAKLDKEYAETGKQAADTVKANADAEKARAEAAQMAAGGPLTPEPSMVFKDAKGVERPVFTNKKGQAFINQDGTMVDVSSKLTRPTPASVVVQNNQAAAAAGGVTMDGKRPDPITANKPDQKLGGLTPNAVYQSAMQLLTTGTYPAQGMGNTGATPLKRDAIVNKAGAIAAEAGMDQPTFRAFYNANKGSLDAVQKQYDAVQSFIGAADKNADLLQKLLPSVGDTGSPIFNKPLRAFEKDVTGNQKLSQFSTYLRSVQNEYARILSQPNLAGQLTDSARHEAEQLIDEKATVPQIIASIQALQTEGQNRILSIGEQIGRIQQRIQSGPAAPSAGAKPPTKSAEELIKQYGG